MKEEGKPFYWTDIRKISGVKKKNMQAVIPYLKKYTDDGMVDWVVALVES